MNFMLKPPLQPMLLSVKEKPFNSKKYLFEFKWDGFRCLLYKKNDDIYLQSRNNNDLTSYFSELKQLKKIITADNVILDGEICYFSSDGKQDFSKLQKRLKSNKKFIEKKYKTTFIVWDIISLNNTPLHKLALMERKEQLKNVISKENQFLQLSPYILHKGEKLYSLAKDKDMEGIVAKKIYSPYLFSRSQYWYKIKIWRYKDVLIGGFSINQDFLLVGIKNKYVNSKLNYMGKVKIALNKAEKTALFNFLPSITTKTKTFPGKLNIDNIEWVKPKIKIKVRYTEITNKNHFRHGYAVELLI